MSSGWTNYTSDSDEEERMGLRAYSTIQVRTPAEEAETRVAQRLLWELRATQGGQVATTSFKAFMGVPHRMSESGIILGLVCVTHGVVHLNRILFDCVVAQIAYPRRDLMIS